MRTDSLEKSRYRVWQSHGKVFNHCISHNLDGFSKFQKPLNLKFWGEVVWFGTNSSFTDATHTNIEVSPWRGVSICKASSASHHSLSGGIPQPGFEPWTSSVVGKRSTAAAPGSYQCASGELLYEKRFKHFWDGIVVKSSLALMILLKGCSLSVGHPFFRNWTNLPSTTYATCHQGTDKNCDVLANGKR